MEEERRYSREAEHYIGEIAWRLELVVRHVHDAKRHIGDLRSTMGWLAHRVEDNSISSPRLGEILVDMQSSVDGIADMFDGIDEGVSLHQQNRPVVAVGIVGLVREAVPFCRARANAQSANFSVALPDVELKTSLQEQGLAIVLQNLVANSLAAEAGHIFLSVSIANTASGKKAVLKLRDDGVGIEPEHLRDVCSAFFTTRSGRSGMGLTTVKYIAEAVGGEVKIKSTWGKGTEITLSFPGDAIVGD